MQWTNERMNERIDEISNEVCANIFVTRRYVKNGGSQLKVKKTP